MDKPDLPVVLRKLRAKKSRGGIRLSHAEGQLLYGLLVDPVRRQRDPASKAIRLRVKAELDRMTRERARLAGDKKVA